MALVQLGIDADRVGHYEQAHAYFEQVMPLYQENRGQHLESFLTYRGLLAHHMGQNEAAVDYVRRSLAGMQAEGDRRSEVRALTVLGHALLDLAQSDDAFNTYRQAVALAYELKRERLAIEPLAGLARVALALGNVSGALEYVGTIRRWLQTQTVEGLDEPLRIYLTCYQVLNAAGDEDAKSILHAAYTMLDEWANKLEVAEQRHAYLYDVAAHRDIVRTWALASRGQQPSVVV
jgi:tetratricopeptide (TPR) repeat protein